MISWAILTELRQYAPFSTMTPEEIESDRICFRPISYDKVFEDNFRKKWGDLAGAISSTAVPVPGKVKSVISCVATNSGE